MYECEREREKEREDKLVFNHLDRQAGCHFIVRVNYNQNTYDNFSKHVFASQ